MHNKADSDTNTNQIIEICLGKSYKSTDMNEDGQGYVVYIEKWNERVDSNQYDHTCKTEIDRQLSWMQTMPFQGLQTDHQAESCACASTSPIAVDVLIQTKHCF